MGRQNDIIHSLTIHYIEKYKTTMIGTSKNLALTALYHISLALFQFFLKEGKFK